MDGGVNLEWTDAPPPSRWKTPDRPDWWDEDRLADGHWIEPWPDEDAWRWAEVEGDVALTLDMTDGGFCWTVMELTAVKAISGYARAARLTLNARIIRRIERILGL